MERKSLCFEGCFKNPPGHIQYLFRRGRKKPKNNKKYISNTDKEFFLPGYLLMEEYDVLTSSYHLKKLKTTFSECVV